MEEPHLFAFMGLMVVVAAAIPWAASQVRKRGSAQVGETLETLGVQGWVAEPALSPQGRHAVRVWGLLAHPVPFDLRVVRRSRLRRAAGSRSTGMLDPIFEEAFRIVSCAPERARVILDPEIQRCLLSQPGAELRLGSFESLLPREYAVSMGVEGERLLRRLWMLRVPGKLAKLGDPTPLGALGALVAAAVEKHGLPPGTPDRKDYETGSAENWL